MEGWDILLWGPHCVLGGLVMGLFDGLLRRQGIAGSTRGETKGDLAVLLEWNCCLRIAPLKKRSATKNAALRVG
jgi:hypothetical protein